MVRMQQDAEWQKYSEAGGELDKLILEQQGELCGPRPSRETGLLGSCDLSSLIRPLLCCNPLDSLRMEQLQWLGSLGTPPPAASPPSSSAHSNLFPEIGPLGDSAEPLQTKPPERLQIASPALLAVEAERRKAEARLSGGFPRAGAPVAVYGADDDSDGVDDGSEEEDVEVEEEEEEYVVDSERRRSV